jgi:nucleoside-diphosphate-sugar epimerase
VVLRFGAFYGPGSEQTELMLRMARRHVGTAIGSPDGYGSPIHLADTGTAVVTALTAPAGTYNVVDDEPLTYRQQAAVVGEAVGASPWLYLPGRMTRFVGGHMAALARSRRVSNARFRALGWAPHYPSVREGVPATVAAIDAGGDGVVTPRPAGG